MANETLAACLAEIKANPGKFYVYILSRPDGTPFYVGVAQARGNRHERIQDHEMYARGRDRSRKSIVIRSILRDGREIGYSVESWHLDQARVFDREVELIAAIGRRDAGAGPLINGNDGGTGQINPGPEIKAKISASQKKRFNRPGVREKQSELARARMADPQMRERLRHLANAYWSDPAAQNQRSKTSKLIWSDEEYRERLVAKHRQRAQSVESKAAFAARIAPHAEAARKKAIEARRADPTYRTRISATMSAKAAIKYDLRSRCIAAAGANVAMLPDHRASLDMWRAVARNLGIAENDT